MKDARVMNFTQFAKKHGYPSDYDVLDHGLLSPNGRLSKRAKDEALQQQIDRGQRNAEAHREFEAAIRRGDIIDSEPLRSRRVTKEGLEASDKQKRKSDIQSKIHSIDSQLRTIANLGSMAHLPNGNLRAKYRRTVDHYNLKKDELMAELQAETEG